MPLKQLKSFLKFQSTEFFLEKKLCYLNCKELPDNEGVKITLLILEDNTDYNSDNTNLGEQITVKVIGKKGTDYEKVLIMKSFNL